MQRIKWWTFCFFLGFSLYLSACSQEKAKTEKEDRLYHKAKVCLENKDFEGALALFKTLSYRYEKAPESHLELGLLYLNSLEDPLAAIYHFRAYLDSLPYAEASPMVRQLVHTATKQFIARLPGATIGQTANDGSVLALRLENEKLKQQLKLLETTATAPAIATAETQNRPLRGKTYTVQAGDTLSTISTKIYGTSAEWKAILKANEGRNINPRQLKIGQELILPE